MEYRKFGDSIYLRLDPGDEVIASLAEVSAREKITAAKISGIGGCKSAVVGVFDLEKKAYNRHEVTALLEMISLDGNVTFYENKPYIHAHATFAYHEGDEAKMLSGHLLEAVIGLTAEIVLTPAPGKITRRYVEELGIRVWDF
jgi:hypothetical protein